MGRGCGNVIEAEELVERVVREEVAKPSVGRYALGNLECTARNLSRLHAAFPFSNYKILVGRNGNRMYLGSEGEKSFLHLVPRTGCRIPAGLRKLYGPCLAAFRFPGR